LIYWAHLKQEHRDQRCLEMVLALVLLILWLTNKNLLAITLLPEATSEYYLKIVLSLLLSPHFTAIPATGQPQRAIFTGHPRLTQGPNKIDADTLTFEMASSRIIAEGHSHSEVINEAAGSGDAPAPATAAATTGGPVKWPGAPDSQAPIKAGNPKAAAAAKEKEKLAQAAKAKADADTVDGDEFDGDGQKIASAPTAALLNSR
jgi:hypothetical protein